MTPLWVARMFELRHPEMESNYTYPDYPLHDESLDILLRVAHKMYTYYVPIIISFGISLNILLGIVLLKTKLRKKFFPHIFASVAIADNGFLLTLLIIWVKDQGVDVYKAPGLCQVVIFMSHFFPFLSFWLSISGCYMFVYRPKSSCFENMCRGPGKARTLVISLSIFTFTVYIYKTWTNGILSIRGHRFCTVLPETKKAMSILNILDVVFLLILPFIMFFVFIIFSTVVKFRRLLLKDGGNMPSIFGDNFRILIMHSLCFMVFVTPGCFSKIVFFLGSLNDENRYNFKDFIIENILQYLFYTYFAVKPLFHFIVSKEFRIHFRQLLFQAKQTITLSRVVLTERAQEQTLL